MRLPEKEGRMDVPSIKGSAFRSVAEDVKRLIDGDRLEAREVAQHLNEKDRGFLDTEVTPLAWCPIATYGRMLELLAREEGGADPIAYLCERGARAAEAMLTGVYESFRAAPGTWGPRVGQTMMGIGKLIYNFTGWSFRAVGPEIFEIEVVDARDYPEPARYTAQGFLRRFAEFAADRPMKVESTRPTPDRIVFRIQPA
jgi:hypothetical protein